MKSGAVSAAVAWASVGSVSDKAAAQRTPLNYRSGHGRSLGDPSLAALGRFLQRHGYLRELRKVDAESSESVCQVTSPLCLVHLV